MINHEQLIVTRMMDNAKSMHHSEIGLVDAYVILAWISPLSSTTVTDHMFCILGKSGPAEFHILTDMVFVLV